jgi:hypothetical protein
MAAHLTAEQRQLAPRLKVRGLSLREIGPQREPTCRCTPPRTWLAAPAASTTGPGKTLGYLTPSERLAELLAHTS